MKITLLKRLDGKLLQVTEEVDLYNRVGWGGDGYGYHKDEGAGFPTGSGSGSGSGGGAGWGSGGKLSLTGHGMEYEDMLGNSLGAGNGDKYGSGYGYGDESDNGHGYGGCPGRGSIDGSGDGELEV